MLKVDKIIEGGKAVVSLSGRLDTTTAPDFEAAVKESIDSIGELTLDFKGLEYISSAGLRVILSVQKSMKHKGGMKVIHVNEDVMEIFEVTGFSDILTIE
ncbi:MAG: STAS domain-containing protein [Clostridiales bacterium]|nr:STAS domain-containing protein [Clostridiales bacterium]